MFSFDKLNQTPDTFVAENYGIEVGGHLLAIQEAFADLADINEEYAMVNNQGVDAYLEGMQSGGDMGKEGMMKDGDMKKDSDMGKKM